MENSPSKQVGVYAFTVILFMCVYIGEEANLPQQEMEGEPYQTQLLSSYVLCLCINAHTGHSFSGQSFTQGLKIIRKKPQAFVFCAGADLGFCQWGCSKCGLLTHTALENATSCEIGCCVSKNCN